MMRRKILRLYDSIRGIRVIRTCKSYTVYCMIFIL